MFLLSLEQHSHQTYILEKNESPENLKDEQKPQEHCVLTYNLGMYINSNMILTESCIYLWIFNLNKTFAQINTNTNGIGLPTDFFFNLTWPAKKTGEGDLLYYLNYFSIQGNQDLLNELHCVSLFSCHKGNCKTRSHCVIMIRIYFLY